MNGIIGTLVSRMGVTVAELKKHIADWPETDAMGEPTEVWLETGHQLSSPCMSIELLNYRMREDGTHTSDLLLCPDSKDGASAGTKHVGTIPTGQGLEKPTIKNNPIIEKAEANLAEAENELFNAQAMPENTILQRFNKLHMVKTKAEGVAHAASILDSHMRETKEGIVITQ